MSAFTVAIYLFIVSYDSYSKQRLLRVQPNYYHTVHYARYELCTGILYVLYLLEMTDWDIKGNRRIFYVFWGKKTIKQS
jgi:hypothetical protein